VSNKFFILIAEDDADDQFILEAAFKECGYKDEIRFVQNGVELLHVLQDLNIQKMVDKKFPGLILLDLNMPKKDGREALKEIKENPDLKKIPVVVFTTTKNENEIKRCYELGANTYVVKPGSFDELVKVIQQIRSYWFNIASVPA
jgi:two-component system response regulator